MGTGRAFELFALVLLAAAIYTAACVIWPYRNCRRCHGTGQLRSPLGRTFRFCPACHHTGYRTRLGRRVYDLTRRHNGKAHR